MQNVEILNVSIHNLSKAELLERLNSFGGFVVTPNVDHLMQFRKDPQLRAIYHQADYRVCDSKIIQFASQFLGNPIQEKISGSDLLPAFYNHNKDNDNVKIFLLGAQEGIANQAQENINQKVGRAMVVDVYSPPFGFETDEKECRSIIERINQSGATVLAVGLGAPKQEKWIAKYKSQLPKVRVFLAVGASIDFEAGHKPRAPQWMSEVGLEWFYRLMCEPTRLWKRYLVDGLPFFGLILQQKLQSISNLDTQPLTTQKSL
jgi:exopolysaccharide biosynthesis WecB/TagA/CpsF family protein